MSYALDFRKVRSPHGAEVFARTRLFRWLDQACSTHPIIWIAGPPGSGKTTLIKSYLAYRNLISICQNVRKSDTSPVNLHAALDRLLRSDIRPEGDDPAQSNIADVTSRPVPEIGTCETVTAQVMVLDGCHEISDEAQTFQYLSEKLDDFPEGRTLILISRSAPPLALMRWSVNHQMAVLGWDELRLTPEESMGIARLHGCKSREHGAVMQADERAAGWVTGLILFLQEMKPERYRLASLARKAEGNIYDYFLSEVFSGLEPRTQEFLMSTALLQSMTVKMVEQLTGENAAENMLADLCKKHFFIDRHASQNERYQFHPLFRNFLLAQADACLATDHLAVLQRRAAELLEDSGQLEGAALQLIHAQDWEALLRLVSRHFAGLLKQGRTQTVESWLHALPAAVVYASPWALYWMGACHLTHCDRSGCAEFSRAHTLFKEEGSAEGFLLSWAGTVDSLLAGHEYQELDQWIDKMDEYLGSNIGFPSQDCEQRVTTSMFAALLYRQPGRCDFGKWQERVKSCLHQSDDATQIIVMARRLLQYQIWFGGSAGCVVIMDAVRILSQLPDQAPGILIQCGLAEGEYLWFTASFQECLKKLRSTLDVALESGLHRWDNELYGLGVSASIGQANYTEAQVWLHKMSTVLYLRPRYETARYHFLSAWCEMGRGDAESAFEHADTARRMFVVSGAILDQVLTDAGLAQISFECGDSEIAAAHLKSAFDLASIAGSAHLDFLCQIIQCSIDGIKAPNDILYERLSHAFAIGSRFDLQNTFWWQRKLIAQASEVALSNGIEIDYVQSIVRKHELTLDNPLLAIEKWPWMLKIYTLGRFSLLKYDQPLWASRKAQHKPLELLKVLIAYGGREVSVDLLASVLWPDAEGDAGQNAFDITLHRLRKLIGVDKVLILRDGRLTLDSRYCWIDTWALERMIGQVDIALRSDRQDAGAILRMSSAILALYQGHYLGKEYSQPWSLNLRERLRSKYLRHVTDMANYLEKNHRWEDAIVYYQKGLEIDELAEQFYQSFMICYQQLGRRSEALAVYRRCRSALSIVLGVEPSSVTESIRKSLLS